MHEHQTAWRALFDALRDYRGASTFDDVLQPWLQQNVAESAWLAALASGTDGGIAPASEQTLWRLYALSRVAQVMVLPFQQSRADGSDWPGPALSADDVERFFAGLGLSVLRPARFTPCHHEIVAVAPADDPRASPRPVAYRWPCLMAGPLLIQRAGVVVRAGATFARPGLADRSTLYWAYRRKYRAYHDLSRGWGSHSAWRTRFRRDYHRGDTFHFNGDGRRDLASLAPEARDGGGLDRAQRAELLMHRGFVVTSLSADDDLWPYEDRLAVPCDAL